MNGTLLDLLACPDTGRAGNLSQTFTLLDEGSARCWRIRYILPLPVSLAQMTQPARCSSRFTISGSLTRCALLGAGMVFSCHRLVHDALAPGVGGAGRFPSGEGAARLAPLGHAIDFLPSASSSLTISRSKSVTIRRRRELEARAQQPGRGLPDHPHLPRTSYASDVAS
jgi:hypothetical protein